MVSFFSNSSAHRDGALPRNNTTAGARPQRSLRLWVLVQFMLDTVRDRHLFLTYDGPERIVGGSGSEPTLLARQESL